MPRYPPLGPIAAKPALRWSIKSFGYSATLLTVAVLGALLMASFATMGPTVPLPVLVATVVALGAVRTMHFNSVNSLTYADVPENKLSSSGASAGVFQQLSMGLGVSVSATMLSMIVPEGALPRVADFQVVFLAMAAIPLLSLPILLTSPSTGRSGGRPRPGCVATAPRAGRP